MLAPDKIIGNEAIQNFFISALERQESLAHAFCFVGPDSVGKKTTAFWVASQLLSCQPSRLPSHPDVTIIGLKDREESGEGMKEIGVDEIRALRVRLGNKPWGGGYQVAIIDRAESLTIAAANTLLRFLEEPTEKTIIFLLAEYEGGILPTILSRVELFYFSLVRENIILDWLSSMGIVGEEQKEAVRWSAGRPGRALELAESPERLEDYCLAERRWSEFRQGGLLGWTRAVEDWQRSSGTDLGKFRNELTRTLEVWTLIAREQMKQEPTELIMKIIDSLRTVQNLLSKNINPRLLMEHLKLGLDLKNSSNL